MEDKLLRILAADSTMNKAVTKVILEILVQNGLTSFEELGQRITKECKEERAKFDEEPKNVTLEDIMKVLEQ